MESISTKHMNKITNNNMLNNIFPRAHIKYFKIISVCYSLTIVFFVVRDDFWFSVVVLICRSCLYYSVIRFYASI